VGRKTRKTKIRHDEVRSNRSGLIGIGFVVVSLAVVVGIQGQTLKKKEHEYYLKEQSLQKQIDEEETLAGKLEEQRIFVQTKQYIEEMEKRNLDW